MLPVAHQTYPLTRTLSPLPLPCRPDFIDIVLSKTQRGTPTVVHNGWQIQRIRQFYMRKVKFTGSNWNEKVTAILDEFPKVGGAWGEL